MTKPYLTVSEVARLIHISDKTIYRLLAAGRIEGFRMPYSRHRRICRKALLRFLAEHDLPIPEELNPMADHRLLAEQVDEASRDIDRARKADPRLNYLVYQAIGDAKEVRKDLERESAKLEACVVRLQELLPNVSADLIMDAINGSVSYDRLLNAN